MSKLNPEDLNVTSFETAGDEDTITLKPPVCESVSRCAGDDCGTSAVCSDPEPLSSWC